MIYWIASISLVLSLALPRVPLHFVGAIGCCIMTERAYSYSQDWPQFTLNLMCVAVHVGMLIKILFWGDLGNGRHTGKSDMGRYVQW